MDLLYSAQISITIFIQSILGWLAVPMQFVTSLGQEVVYLFLIPTIYWCIDATLGLRIGLFIILNDSVNIFFKFLFQGPRPYWMDPRVRAFSPETSFGIPSGHAQTSSGVWLFLAATYHKFWFTVIALVVIFLIGFSRVFLGSHFITDVVGAWILSSILVFSFLKLEHKVINWVKKLSLGSHIWLSFYSSLMIIFFNIFLALLSAGYVLPAAWVKNAAVAYPGVQITPFSITPAFTISGTWFGLLAGFSWTWNKIGIFNSRGPLFQRLVRYFIGGVGAVIILNGLEAISPAGHDLVSYSLRYLRYTFIGLWITGFAPLLFVRLKLATFIPRRS